YWHFLFVIWLLLFALLTSSPETYKTIAQLCGF
ncbi:MAG: cytochrome c oxidase subunit 3, partial [Glaciecola sp.]